MTKTTLVLLVVLLSAFSPARAQLVPASRLLVTPGSAVTFYVGMPVNGCSDTNTGLSASAPWCTLQRAWNYIQGNLDLGSPVSGTPAVIVQLLDGGPYAPLNAQGGILGQSSANGVTFQGNCTTPAAVVVSGNGVAIGGDDQAMFAVKCMTLNSTRGSNLVQASHGSIIVIMGTMATSGGAGVANFFSAFQVGQIWLSGGIDIQISGSFNGAIFEASGLSAIYAYNLTVTFTNNPALSQMVNGDSGSYIEVADIIWTGGIPASTQSYKMGAFSEVDTGGACSSIPGGVAGTGKCE